MNIIDAPMRITRGEPFSWSATVTGQDWTGYTGTVTFRSNRPVRRMLTPDYGFTAEADPILTATVRMLTPDYGFTAEADPILTATVTGSALGVLSFSLTAAETDLFPALDRMGWFAQAKAEISMTDGTDVAKYQTRVSTAQAFA